VETFATVDSRVSFVCVAAGNPPPTITWTLDDEPLTPTDDDNNDDDAKSRYVIVSSVTLDGDVVSYVNVSGVRVTDGGTYRCTARNRVGVEAFSGKLFVYGMRINSQSVTTNLFFYEVLEGLVVSDEASGGFGSFGSPSHLSPVPLSVRTVTLQELKELSSAGPKCTKMHNIKFRKSLGGMPLNSHSQYGYTILPRLHPEPPIVKPLTASACNDFVLLF